IRYQELTPMLLNEVQHQQRQLAELKAQNARLQAAVVQQQKQDAALAARLERLEAAAGRAATVGSRQQASLHPRPRRPAPLRRAVRAAAGGAAPTSPWGHPAHGGGVADAVIKAVFPTFHPI